jgi:hypothetical protein
MAIPTAAASSTAAARTGRSYAYSFTYRAWRFS